jgi:oxygen-dependent protoporphyrinogen oxidase
MTTGTRVLVVGGGITGLAAAWEAARGGAAVTLVEAGPRLGGKVRTERTDGLLIEHGPDSFVAYRPAALELIDELGLAGEVIGVQGRREVHLRVGGRMRPIPAGMGMVLPTRLGPFAATRVLTWPQKARAGLDLVLPRRLGPEDISIGAFLRARLGDGVVERFAEPLVGGIYGAGVDRLSLDAVLPSLRDSERVHRSLMLASLAQGRAARRRTGAAPASPFRSLAGGLGSLAEALSDQARALGADLRTGSAVKSLARSDGRTTATLADGSSAVFDAVVLAVGAAPMADLLAPHAPAAAEALRKVPQASSTVVTIALPVAGFGEPPTSQGWLEVGPAPISGVTISSTKWAGRAPTGTVLLRAFVPDRLGPLARRPDAEVLDAVIGHVSTVLGFTGRPELTRVSRWTEVMPTYTVGHLARVAAVESALAGLPGWQVAGAALHGVGIPECIADGRRAAREVLGAGSTTPAQL